MKSNTQSLQRNISHCKWREDFTNLGSVVQIGLSDILSEFLDAGELARDVLRTRTEKSRSMKLRGHVDDSAVEDQLRFR